jgi:TonB family protein
MNMALVIPSLLLLLQLLTAAPPVPPAQAIGSSVVILDGTVNSQGRLTNLHVLQGMTPFVQPSLEAIKEWSFAPEPVPRPTTVTFLYRARTVLPDQPYEFALRSPCCAVPTYIVDPGYPINSIGEGSVIMQVRINAQGSVESVHTIWPEPSLTEAAVQAVRRWHFTSNGPSSTIVVISFLRPSLS